MNRIHTLALVSVLALAGCRGPLTYRGDSGPSGADAGRIASTDAGRADAGMECPGCGDGLFCNGEERCDRGMCTRTGSPCPPGVVCNEAADRCEGPECIDRDGDGQLPRPCGGDCNDGDANTYEGARERCNMQDEDCDGMIDEGLPAPPLYRDADGDMFGSSETGSGEFPGPGGCTGMYPGFVRDATDCDDMNRARHPGHVELCDAIDNDCDGTVDEACP